MTDEDWGTGFAKSVAVFLNGHGIPYLDARGQRVLDDSFVLCFNAHHEPIEFTLPPTEFGDQWRIVVDTGADEVAESEELRGRHVHRQRAQHRGAAGHSNKLTAFHRSAYSTPTMSRSDNAHNRCAATGSVAASAAWATWQSARYAPPRPARDGSVAAHTVVAAAWATVFMFSGAKVSGLIANIFFRVARSM